MDIILLVFGLYNLFITRKIKYTILCVILLATQLLGLRQFYASFAIYGEATIARDMAFVLAVITSVVAVNRYPRHQLLYEENAYYKYIYLFLGFIGVACIIDILFNHINLISIIKTSRHWLFLLAFLPLTHIPTADLHKVIKHLMWWTIIASAIIVVEFIFNIHYFTPDIYERQAAGMTVQRGTLPSTFAMFYVFMIVSGYGNFSKFFKYLILSVLIFSLLLSATKSIALALLIGVLIIIWYKNRAVFIIITKYIGIAIAASIILLSIPSLRGRFAEAANTFGTEKDGSATFRYELALERFNYIMTKPQYILFGIGNITEDQFPTAFSIGLLNDDSQRVTQLDTGDICWALLFLRLGLVGTVFWIFLFIKMIIYGRRYSRHPFAIPLITYLIISCFVSSFAETTEYIGTFWIVPLMLFTIVCKESISSDNLYT